MRLYHMLFGPKQKLLNDFLRDVVIPAMNRNGMAPIGVFTVQFGPNTSTLYLLIPHKSLESVVPASSRLLGDAEYGKAGAAIINAPISDPTYLRMESSLLAAFAGMRKLEVPATTAVEIIHTSRYCLEHH
ncbi:MAG: NIPSNAP family protein [Pyrinomonadaceae bacterium]